MTLWFGAPWPSPDFRAPICENDADRIETPHGAECCLCHDPIGEGEQGTAIPLVRLDGDDKPVYGGMVYEHKECGLRSVLGCHGNLVGEGHSHDVPYREDARKVEDWLHRHGTWSL